MKTKEEYDFELGQLRERTSRHIGRVIVELKTLQDMVERPQQPLYEHYMPQQSIIDMAMTYGRLLQLQEMKM
jgi:hypothetical protein